MVTDRSVPLSCELVKMKSRRNHYRSVSLVAVGKKRRCDNRCGAVAVEFAVVAPIFFALVFGLVEFGRMTMVKQSLSDAARSGCRTASLATTVHENKVEAAVREHFKTFISSSCVADTCRVSVESLNFQDIRSGDPITVNVELDFSNVSWISGGFLDAAILTGESTTKRE